MKLNKSYCYCTKVMNSSCEFSNQQSKDLNPRIHTSTNTVLLWFLGSLTRVLRNKQKNLTKQQKCCIYFTALWNPSIVKLTTGEGSSDPWIGWSYLLGHPGHGMNCETMINPKAVLSTYTAGKIDKIWRIFTCFKWGTNGDFEWLDNLFP